MKSIDDLEVDPHLDLSYASSHRDALRKMKTLLKDRIKELDDRITSDYLDEWLGVNYDQRELEQIMIFHNEYYWREFVRHDSFKLIQELQSILGKGD